MGFTPSAAVSGALLTALLLTGCTAAVTSDASSSGTSPSAVEVSSTDEMFVQMMIPHHEQAVDMAELMLDKTDIDARVTALAEQILAAQEPEIETMRAWLAEWGVSEWGSTMSGMDHGDGMMSAGDLAALETATGAEASRLFLEQMIVHHDGAVLMAQSIIDSTQHPEIAAFATQVVADQTAEINTMQELLNDI
ncbi:MAG: DUF305 domain-containing protein [Leifsonia sp.]|nr:DUF305 domain-containing protein [Leifsonia sp.]MAT17487.1 DUF305 domain-containing protein [Leifsonia sp.]|tara:strand:+ start:61209 stop:61790 length:582 start_codon:yes stop_codon:yes gene_type:complete